MSRAAVIVAALALAILACFAVPLWGWRDGIVTGLVLAAGWALASGYAFLKYGSRGWPTLLGAPPLAVAVVRLGSRDVCHARRLPLGLLKSVYVQLDTPMKATTRDLRYKMKDILRAIDRGETVTVLNRGKEKARLVPIGTKPERELKPSDNPF